jgi:hypothetical protein
LIPLDRATAAAGRAAVPSSGALAQGPEPGKAVYKATLAELIAAGLLSPPLRLYRRYKGVDLEAVLLPDGRVRYCYNWAGLGRYTIAADKPLPAGEVTIRYEFAYEGGGAGKGGKGTLFVNGEQVAEGRIDHTIGYAISSDDAADVGVDEGTPVTEDYKERENKFTGKIRKVTVEL